MVEWKFLWYKVKKIELPRNFIYKVKFLLINAKTCMKINGSISKPFKIKRGVRQGWILVLYLFLVVVEVLNIVVMKEANVGLIKGIQLPIDN